MSHHERKILIDLDDTLSLSSQTKLLGISRSSLYYTPYVSEEEIKIRNTIDKIFTDYPFFGSRSIRDELAEVYNINICRDQVRRHMREMGLEAIYPKQNTSKQHPAHPIYPYLLRNITASHPNHIWSTDITYIKLAKGFCYLVALMDWYSRYVISWTLSPTLEIDFCLENLSKALRTAVPEIHNSDQGSHFTSPQYTNILKNVEVQISMDGRGRCLDNIFVERLWRTVKYENVYLRNYNTIIEAQSGLSSYFPWYNTERRHSSLNKHTPYDIYTSKFTIN